MQTMQNQVHNPLNKQWHVKKNLVKSFKNLTKARKILIKQCYYKYY